MNAPAFLTTRPRRAVDVLDLRNPPVVLAYGIGVDSTAMSVENRLAHMAIAV